MRETAEICVVCSAPNATQHLGAMTCRACAAFFRRCMMQRDPVEHDGDCLEQRGKAIAGCRACRMAKCLRVGMRPLKAVNAGTAPQQPIQCPTLQSMQAAYEQLIDWRKTHYRTRKGVDSDEKDMLGSHKGFLDDLRIGATLDANFMSTAFESDLKELDKEQKLLLFRHFYMRFACADTAYGTFCSGQTESFGRLGGPFANGTQLEYVRKDGESFLGETPERFLCSLQKTFMRVVVSQFFEFKLNRVEFMIVTALLLWDAAIEGIDEATRAFAKRMRNRILNEAIAYYSGRLTAKKAGLRLGALQLLLPVIEAYTIHFTRTFEFAGVFRFHHIDPELDEIVTAAIYS